MHRANSSSCGRVQPAFILSIGRCEGVRNPTKRVKNSSVRRQCVGSRHWYVLAKLWRSSKIRYSCRSVVPVRQWPMMKIGACEIGVRRICGPYQQFCKMLSRVWQKLTKVMMMAIHQYGRPMANRLRTSKRAQATKWHPSHMCGDHSCFREVWGLLMLFRIIGGLLLFQNQAWDQGYIFTRANECSKRIA